MTTEFSIPFLDRDVALYFEREGIPAEVVGGRRQRVRRTNHGPDGVARVVFSFGDAAGRLGRIAPTVKPGHRVDADGAASVANAEFLYSVSVFAADRSRPNDEHAQLDAAFRLFEKTARAVQEIAAGNFSWGSIQITPSPTEIAFGCELLAELTHRFPVYDRPFEYATPDGVVTPDLVLDPP